jgi:hypothetical protein
MIFMPLAAVALSASAAISPFSHLMHKHPTLIDNRVSVTLHNRASIFQDVKVDGHRYTVPGHRGIVVKAPIGTVVYADSSTGELRRGDKVVELSESLNEQTVDLK